ncbi:MAG: M56 family peptidase, partial [Acidobacteria bacterium]
MTDLPWYFQNLLRYSLQLCLLIGAAALAEKFLPLRLPRLSYAYWRVLLLVSLALPLLQPWPGPVRRFLPTGSDVAVIQDLSASTVTVASQGPAEWQIPYLPVLAGVLIVGMLFRLSRLLVGALSLRHALKRSRPAVLPWNMSQLAPGGGKQPRVVCVESVTSPATYGLFRPVILLPLGFSELTETQQLGVICHELRHVQRHDWLFRFAEEIVRCLFWFHPLVLWLTRRIELSREQSVDQEVVQILGQSRDYLDSLVEMAGARLSGPVAALFLSESYLRQRVRLIKEGFTMSTRRLSISLSLSFVFLLTAGAVAVWAFPLQGREQDQARPAGVPGGSAVESQKRGPESDAGGKQELIRVGGNVQRSKLIHWVPPEYPPDAEKAGIKGIVLLKVTVSETGDVTEVEDVRGHPMLVNAARAAVQQWKYSPTMLNGRAVPVIATQTVTFPPGNEPDKLSAGQSLPLGPGSAVPLHMDESGALFMGQERLDETNMRQVLQ